MPVTSQILRHDHAKSPDSVCFATARAEKTVILFACVILFCYICVQNRKCVIMRIPLDFSLNIRGRLVDLSAVKVMGIVNCTPDSFFRAGASDDVWDADILDIGAYSTRPGHGDVSEEEERNRLKAFFGSHKELTVGDRLMSVDTFRASVARMCVEEYGVGMVNDVSGGADREMFRTVAELGVPYVLTHSGEYRGLSEMMKELIEKVQTLRDLGQNDIVIDPGFGFGKTLDDNYDVLANLEQLHLLDLPILVGLSRKSMIQKALGCTASEALNGTTALNTIAVMKGARILRVHDVKEAREIVRLWEERIRRG